MGNLENNRIGFYFVNLKNENNNIKKFNNNYCYKKKNDDPSIQKSNIVNEEEKKNEIFKDVNKQKLLNNNLSKSVSNLLKFNKYENEINKFIKPEKSKSKIDLTFNKIFKFNRSYRRAKTIHQTSILSNKLLEIKNELDNSNIKKIEYLNQNDFELNFIRNGDEIRNSYISKLITKNILTGQKEKSHNSIIIFDWDDTLFPTSSLTKNGIYIDYNNLTEKEKEKISNLEELVLNVLTLSIEKGDTFIITNAGKGWVEFSSMKYYPKIKNVLEKIKIISARENYENKYPNDSQKWKMLSFLDVQKNLNCNLVTNIICLGDSFIEIQAGLKLASMFTQAFIKVVKFRESPKFDELIKQLKLIYNQFNTIYSSVKNLTIKVEKKKK